ncbi:hypothetical protein [Mesorhizobium sp.]|uniref:hypothetical protein n=1 Tax=Mesorhizobium sp. TaxID=1871066 RepID=UPI00257F8B9B|nr:hypothetical protein [Mesorhizobium sp.]
MSTTTRAVYVEPFFARRQRLDVYEHLRVRSLGGNDMAACQVRRDQPGLGLTLPHARSETFLASIFVGGWSDGDLWCDERHLRQTSTPSGGLGIFDLRQSWVADLAEPFAALHVYMPMRALNELTDELRVPAIEQLVCTLQPPPRDEVLLHLVSALLPAISKPWEANALFADYVFVAIRMHLARTYGGLKTPSEKATRGLAPWREGEQRNYSWTASSPIGLWRIWPMHAVCQQGILRGRSRQQLGNRPIVGC